MVLPSFSSPEPHFVLDFLLLIQILFFTIQAFSRVYNDKSAMKAARVTCHMHVPTSLLGHLHCPNNGNRAFSAQQCKNYLLQGSMCDAFSSCIIFALWMAVLLSPFVYGNIENYKEIKSQSWHMSGMRFNSTFDSTFQISSFNYFSKWEIIWFAGWFFTKTNNKKEKSNTLCQYIDIVMRDVWKQFCVNFIVTSWVYIYLALDEYCTYISTTFLLMLWC